MIFLFSLFFSFSSVYALECVLQNEKISDGTKNSLFDSGRVLSTFKTQDQDGMGSCYANSLTVAIKATHKDHPDVSYIHASFLGTSSRLKGDKNFLVDPSTDKLFNWGGSSCQNFDELKQKGGACDAKAVSLENDDRQESLLKKMGKILDYFSHDHKIPRQEFRKTIENFLEKRDKINLDLMLACLEDKEKGFSGTETIDQWLRVALIKKRSPECRDLLLDTLQKLYTPESIIKSDRIFGELNADTSSKLRKFFSSPEMKKSFLKYSIFKAKSDYQNIMDLTESIVLKLEKILKTKDFLRKCPEEDLITPELSVVFINELYEHDLGLSSIKCETLASSSLLSKIKRLISFDQPLACLPESLKLFSEDVISNIHDFETLFGRDFLTKMLDPKDEDLYSIFGQLAFPNCQDKSHLISLQDLACKWVDLKSVGKKKCPDSTSCNDLDMDKIREAFQQTVLPLLKKDQPVMISVCTSFLQNTEFKRTNQCKDNSNSVKGHSRHGLTVSGYRCQNGKIQYQIQNSWGGMCPSGAGSKYKNSYLDCELDKQGKPIGRFWVDEEVLLDSTTDISYLQNI